MILRSVKMVWRKFAAEEKLYARAHLHYGLRDFAHVGVQLRVVETKWTKVTTNKLLC